MKVRCTAHNMMRKLKDIFTAPKTFSRHQWLWIFFFCLALFVYLGYRRDQGIKVETIRKQKSTGGLPGCVEAVKQKDGSVKCIECKDDYRMSKGKCVRYQ